MRSIKWFGLTLAACLALTSCGGGGSDSPASPTTNSGTTTTSAPVTTPATNSTAFADPTATPVSSGSANTVPITVSAFSTIRNFPMVSVTVCGPNSNATNTCATIDHVLIDTGSFGLRLIASAIPAATRAAFAQQTQGALPVAECASFGSGNTWGTLQNADVKMSSEVAQNVPIQVIADPNLTAPIPTGILGCRSGPNMATPAQLGANGILGIGTSPNDCGIDCQNSTVVGAYYLCNGTSCSIAQVTVPNQVTNPVTLFPVDKNGVIVEMAQVPDTGAATGTGTLVFGIDTQPNNALAGTNATILTTTVAGDVDALFEGRTYTKTAFFDSGSSAFFIESSTLPTGTGGFHTPSTPTGLTAKFKGTNGVSTAVNFNVSNGVTLIGSGNFAFNNWGIAAAGMMDIGMPFFYGRHMFVGFSGATSSAGVGPYVAYVSS